MFGAGFSRADNVKIINNFNVSEYHPKTIITTETKKMPVWRGGSHIAKPTNCEMLPVWYGPDADEKYKSVRAECDNTRITKTEYVARDEIVYDEPVNTKRTEHSDSILTMDFYAAIKYLYTFANFSNKHYSDDKYCVGSSCKDTYSFVSMSGFSASLGAWISEKWRLEVTGGMTGKYRDIADGYEYDLSAKFLELGALYNTTPKRWGGFYVGPVAGVAWVETFMDGAAFLDSDASAKTLSFTGGLNAGYQFLLNDNLVLDIGYKLWFMDAGDHSRKLQITDTGGTYDVKFTNKTGWVMNNSLSIGIRYNF